MMLELGIIEVSSSEWCSPVDFRYLNAVSQFDPYPMPRIDDLVERVGIEEYITTLDLSKGYWQVALAPEAQESIAFKTLFGIYQFKLIDFDRAFRELKEAICTNLLLHCPDFDKQFTLQTDASGTGLGGICCRNRMER